MKIAQLLYEEFLRVKPIPEGIRQGVAWTDLTDDDREYVDDLVTATQEAEDAADDEDDEDDAA